MIFDKEDFESLTENCGQPFMLMSFVSNKILN